jgi:hypothetical protein
MSALRTLKETREAGLILSVSSAGKIAYRGPREAFERFAPVLRSERDAILDALAEERRANVERLLDAMAAENERRRHWHTKSVEGWPGRLTWTSVVTGEAKIIKLCEGRARL